VDILLAPVRVQGAEAPHEIIRALDCMQSMEDVDVIIVARGGGSLEDLAPFNDEGVARAIFRSRIPVISGVGHEIDFTIADFVADLRAPTPSAAAELAVPVRRELVLSLEGLQIRLSNNLRRVMAALREQSALLERRLKDPKRRITDLRLLVDDRMERLKLNLDYKRAIARSKVRNLEIRLHHANPLVTIRDYRFILENARKNMIAGWNGIEERLKVSVTTCMAVLDSLSPLAVLKRGYSVVRKLPEGMIVKDAAFVDVGSNVDIKVASGSFQAKVTDIHKE
jgi:exodeoxyribonuclease VII large subunit